VKKFISISILVCFLVTGQAGQYPVFAQSANPSAWRGLAEGGDFHLPTPGVMVHLSPEFDPPILKGIKVHPDNPFRFDFILDQGDEFARSEGPQQEQTPYGLKTESTKLIKYFLASLTIPEKDLWVNLSPYEKDRIIPNSFGLTEMGRDLLAEDYMLKQITASLIYPEGETGKKFWKRIYEEAAKKFGTTNIPVNTFNKVWIVPQKAVVYENAKAGTAYIVDSKLKVMLEEDYFAMSKHRVNGEWSMVNSQKQNTTTIDQLPSTINQLGSQIVREIVIPELTKEVNEDKNFAQLRQVYNSLILATWYKKKIKDSILEQVYADKKRVAGVNIDDPKETQKIYERYLQAFKKGVYNYIKEEQDPLTQQVVPRKYFSGGLDLAMNATHFDFKGMQVVTHWDGLSQINPSGKEIVQVRVDEAMTASAKNEVLSKFKRGLVSALILAVSASNFSINDNVPDLPYIRFESIKDQLSDVPADSVYFGVIRDLTDKINNGDPDATIKLIELSSKNNNLGRLSSDYIKFLTFKDIARVLVRSFDQEFFDNVYDRNQDLFEKTSIEDMGRIYMSLNVPNAESTFFETVGYLYARHHYGNSKDKKSINFLLAYAHRGNHTAIKYLLTTHSPDFGAIFKNKEPIDIFFKEFDFTDYIKDLDLKEDHYLFRDLIKAGNRSVIDFIVKKAKANDIEAWGLLLDDTIPGYYPEKDIKGIVDSFNFNSYQGVELLGKLLVHGNVKGIAKLYDMLEKGDVRALVQLFELSIYNPDVEKRLNTDRDKIFSIFKSRKSLVDLLYVFHNQYLEFYNAPVDENDLDSVLFFLKHTDFESREDVKKKVDVRRKYLFENKVNPFALENKYHKDEIDRYQFQDILDDLIRVKNKDAFIVLTRQVKSNDVVSLRPVLGLAEDEGFFAADARAFMRTFHFDPSPDAMKGWEFDELILLASAVDHGNVQARAIFKDRILKEKPSELARIVSSIRNANLLISIGLMDILTKNYDPVFMEKFRAKFWGESSIQSFVYKHLMPEGAEFAYRGYFDMARKGSDELDRTLKSFFIDSRAWKQDKLDKISKIDFRSLLRLSDAKNIYIELLLRRLSELGVASATEALDAYGFSNDYSPGLLTEDNLNERYQTAQNFLGGLQRGGFKKFIETIGPYDLPTMKRFMIRMYSSILIVENIRVKILGLDKMNRLLSLIPYLVEIETDYDNADNSLNIGFYLIKNMKDFEELEFVLGHEQGHNILKLLLGYDILTDNKIDEGLNEAFGDWMGVGFVITPGEASRILHGLASPLKADLTEKYFNEMEGHDQARSLEMVLLETATKYGLNGQDILKQLVPYSKNNLTRKSRLEKVFYTSLTKYFSSRYGMRQIPIPVGDNLRSNIDSIFKYYASKNAKKRPGDKAMSADNGGIDLTPVNMRLQTQNVGGGIKFRMDPAMLQQLQNAPGFVPVIINIQPLGDLRLFLGLNTK